MDMEVFSYRYGREVLEHPNFVPAWQEIEAAIRAAPLFTYPMKSSKNRRLDVVQQLMNAYFARAFAIKNGWGFHPLATSIQDSQLRADFRKSFTGRDGRLLSVQAEVQFGNMARFYSDIFKFQTAYSQKLIQLGLSIVPVLELARRIDSNVVNFERATRELPSAELSITLPIVLIGIKPNGNTTVHDVSQCKFEDITEITGKGNSDNLRRIVDAHFGDMPMSEVSPASPVGPDFPATQTEV